MAPPAGPYSGTSSLALVARASAFTIGLVYGSLKLSYLKVGGFTFFLAFVLLGQMRFLQNRSFVHGSLGY
ncbi:hypothetical protein H6P81_018934 [Aristolochia fimbriata]|uniref:Uncharacterized protein n=1 Tax=Aristolochia fimbriata TaxID=158543 RepID=A0AAV7E4N1_ARIFI|nr:hypothetical protein H6P81_018934 [Aristolochia fimbriata]